MFLNNNVILNSAASPAKACTPTSVLEEFLVAVIEPLLCVDRGGESSLAKGPNGPPDPNNPPIIRSPNPAVCRALESALSSASETVFDPTTSCESVLKDRSVPSTVMPGAPGVKVVPATVKAVGPAVKTCPLPRVVVIDDDEGVSARNPSPAVSSPGPAVPLCRAMVLDPMMSWAAVLRDTSVPSIVTCGAPGVKVLPPMDILSGAAVMVWPPIVVVIGSRDAD